MVLSQFVYPRQLQLEERRGFEMRVSGFDSDALAECAAYARYWAGVQAQQYGYGQAYGPAASYVPPHYGTSPVAGYAPPAYAPPASPAVDPAAAIAPPAHVPSVAPPVEVEAEGSPAPHDASAADPAKVEQAAGVMPSSKDDVGLHDGATKPSPAAVEAPSQEAASTTTD